MPIRLWQILTLRFRGSEYLAGLLLALAFYWPMLPGDAAWSPFGDYYQQARPNRVFSECKLRSGELPFWTDALFAGYPFLSDPQTAVFHPLHLAQALIGAAPVSQRVRDFTYFVHVVSLVPALVLLARAFGMCRIAALVAAVIGGLSGFVIMHLGHSEYVEAFVLGMWAVAAMAWALRRNSPGWAICSGLLLGCTLLAGHPQPFLHCVYAMAAGGIAWAVSSSRRERSLKPIGRAVGLGATMLIVAVLASAVQWTSTLELKNQSVRDKISLAASSVGTVPFCHAAGLVAPGIHAPLPMRLEAGERYNPLAFGWGMPGSNEFEIYSGVSAVLLALGGVFWTRRKAVTTFLALGVLLILLAAFGWCRVYEALFRFAPGFSSFRIPPRLLAIGNILLGVLAGMAVHNVLVGHEGRRTRGTFLLFVGTIGAVWIVAMIWLLRLRTGHGTWFEALRAGFVRLPVYDFQHLRTPGEFAGDITLQLLLAALISLVVAACLVPCYALRGRQVAAVLLLVVVYGEVFVYGSGRSIIHPRDHGAGVAAEMDSLYRAVGNVPGRMLGYRQPLSASINNAMLVPGRRYAGGYNPLTVESVVAVMPFHEYDTAKRCLTRLDLWNVTHLAFGRMGDIIPAGWAEIGRDDAEVTETCEWRFQHVAMRHIRVISSSAHTEGLSSGTEMARLRVHGEDGSVREIPMLLGDHVRDGADASACGAEVGCRLAFEIPGRGPSEPRHPFFEADFDLGTSLTVERVSISMIPHAPARLSVSHLLTSSDGRHWNARYGNEVVGDRLVESRNPDYLVFERKPPPGFAWMVPEASGVSYRGHFRRLTARLDNPTFDCRRTVLVSKHHSSSEEIARGNAPDPQSFVSEVNLTRDGVTRLHLETTSSQRGWLVVSSCWYPGWSAELDGRPAPLVRANGSFCAVAVPGGTHRVILQYRNRAFPIGLGLSLSAVGVALVYGGRVFLRWRRWRASVAQ